MNRVMYTPIDGAGPGGGGGPPKDMNVNQNEKKKYCVSLRRFLDRNGTV